MQTPFLREHKKVLYNGLLPSGERFPRLIEIDQQTQKTYDHLMNQITVRAGITQQLKATDQMAWVCAMNNICSAAEECIFNELIYL